MPKRKITNAFDNCPECGGRLLPKRIFNAGNTINMKECEYCTFRLRVASKAEITRSYKKY